MYEDVLDSLELRNYPATTCLDAAYERRAILEGWRFTSTFPENAQLYKDTQEIRKRHELDPK